jgi:methyl-accepting chemotaxis protein
MLNYKLINHKKLSDLLSHIESLEKDIDSFTRFIQNLELDKVEDVDLKALPQKSKLYKSIADLLDKILKVNHLENERSWEIEGSAKFSEILRANNHDLKLLCNHLISELVNYISAIQGGVFILNDEKEQPALELIACYAYNRKKFIQKIIPVKAEFAEDLVAQVFVERKTIYLSNLPKDYVKITSGLGEATPNYLIILPLCFQDICCGVIELASFHPMEAYHLRFLEKLAETVASTISSVKTNQQTRVLLQETQIQAEKLLAQEEEIRQNNEELMATQEEMRRRSIELDGQLSAINNSSIVKIELNTKGIIENVNPYFSQLFKYQSEEVIGQRHILLVGKEEQESEEYKSLWEKLRNGNVFNGEVKRVSKEGSTIWLKATYFPVFNSEKQVYKIIKLAIDITESKTQYEELQHQTQKMVTNEVILKKSYENLLKVREDLKNKINEVEQIKAQEALRFKEKDEATKTWMNKALDKFKKSEDTLKQQIQEKNLEIEQLKNQIIKLKEDQIFKN